MLNIRARKMLTDAVHDKLSEYFGFTDGDAQKVERLVHQLYERIL